MSEIKPSLTYGHAIEPDDAERVRRSDLVDDMLEAAANYSEGPDWATVKLIDWFDELEGA